MRKIKFPFELDATEIMSDSAKAKVRHVNAKLKEVEKARAERLKVAKRTKADPTASTQKQNLGEDPGEAFLKSDEEVKRRAEEKAELEKLVNEDLKKDEGANVSGLYDLIGIVAHKGSSAE
jgi:ubiquitin carboxyl-terminal hydrolase 14